MRQEMQSTLLAVAVMIGLLGFQQCADSAFNRSDRAQCETENKQASAEAAQPAATAVADKPSPAPKAELAEHGEEEAPAEGIRKVNAEFKEAFDALGGHMGDQWRKLDQAITVTDMKLTADHLKGRIDRLEERIARKLGLEQAEAEVLPIRQLHEELLHQIAAAEQTGARDWKHARADQRASFRFLRKELHEEIDLAHQLIREIPEDGEADPQLASSGK